MTPQMFRVHFDNGRSRVSRCCLCPSHRRSVQEACDKVGWKEACSDLARMVDHAWLRHRIPEKVGMPWDTAMGDMVGDSFLRLVCAGGRKN